MPGGSFPEIPERAAKLYHDVYAPLLLPSGGVSVKSGKFNGVKLKTDIYIKEYKTDCEFYTDVLLKNGVPRDSIICEDQSCHTRDNAFAVFKVGGFVAKIYAPKESGMDTDSDYKTELFGMERANRLGILAPQLLASGTVEDKYY